MVGLVGIGLNELRAKATPASATGAPPAADGSVAAARTLPLLQGRSVGMDWYAEIEVET